MFRFNFFLLTLSTVKTNKFLVKILNDDKTVKSEKEYELRHLHDDNDSKQLKSPTTPNYHQNNQIITTPTSSNSLKKMFLNGVNKKTKLNLRHSIDNNNNLDYDEIDDDENFNDGFSDDILSQSLTNNNISNIHTNKKSLSKTSLRNCIVPLSPNQKFNSSFDGNSMPSKRIRTTSGSSNKADTYTQIINS